MSGIARIYRRNPLAFPGRQPGFDPSHIAAGNLRYSAIATGKNFVQIAPNLVKGTTAASNAGIINGNLGPCASTNGTNFDTCSVPAISPPVADAQLTLAALGIWSAFGSQTTTVACSGSTVGFLLQVGSTGILSVTSTTPSYGLSSAFTLALNTPYFVAASFYIPGGSGTLVINFVIVNLLNGATFTSNTTHAGATSIAPTGVINVLNSASGGNHASAASMVSGTYLSKAALLQWAQSPWDFWYPPLLENLLFSSLTGVSGDSFALPGQNVLFM